MNSKVAIVCTNDIHCACKAEPGHMGLSGVRACVDSCKERFGADSVLLVDAGDALGVGALGRLSDGMLPLELMNECGYDVACPGNADVTFGLERLTSLAASARFPFVCCNLASSPEAPQCFSPFTVIDVGGHRIGFVGVITPQAAVATEAACFREGVAHNVLDCMQDATGKRLYAQVQQAVDAARAQGAQRVVLLSHLGQERQAHRYRSDVVAANTRGIDLVVDGHSHERLHQHATNRDGACVTIVQCGVCLSDIGVAVLDLDSGRVEACLVSASEVVGDLSFERLVESRCASLSARLERGLCSVPSALEAFVDDGVSWLVRCRETNLGDLVADAYREAFEADVALIPSWTIRDGIPAGQMTLGSLCRVLPLGHEISCAMITGKAIADALEYACAKLPGPSRYLLQVSGISFRVDTSSASGVQTDPSGAYIAVAGARRVSDVLVGTAPLDEERLYKVAGPAFVICGGGSGFSMLRGPVEACDERKGDLEVFERFCREHASRIGAGEYSAPAGRIAVR